MSTAKITPVPLNRLEPWKGNVRKTQLKADVEALAASLAAHGQRQPLTAIMRGKKFEVIDGGLRLAAFQLLAKGGDIKASHPVNCIIEKDIDNAAEISLVSNVMRVNMHPADEFEAFAGLIEDDKMSVDAVALRFGKSERYVQQRLKLAKTSKKVLKSFREGKLTLAQVEAFTVTDDHKRQDAVLGDFDMSSLDADDIREQLSDEVVFASDKRLLFVGEKAYEKAGGTFRTGDLFSNDDARIVDQPDLLQTLALSKLDGLADKLSKEGWKWTTAMVDYDYETRTGHLNLKEEYKPLPAKEQKKLDKLEAAYQKSEDAFNNMAEDADFEKLRQQRFDAKAAYDAQLKTREAYWPEDKIAIGGAIVYIDKDGTPFVVRGLLKPEDKKQAKAVTSRDDTEDGENDDGEDTASGDASTAPEEEEKSGLPASLVEQLTAEKSAALSAMLLNDPATALKALVHSFASQVFYDGRPADSALQITLKQEKFREVEGSPALEVLTHHRNAWLQQLPEAETDLRGWIVTQPDTELMLLLTFCIAQTLNARLRKTDFQPQQRLKDAEAIARATRLDMAKWFTPTADNYFNKINKAQLLEDVKDFAPARHGYAAACKAKGTIVGVAVEALAAARENGVAWLPKLLRAGET